MIAPDSRIPMHDIESQVPIQDTPGQEPLSRIWTRDNSSALPVGGNVQAEVSEGFETVAYPGGVQQVREDIPGPPPDPQHETRGEIYQPQALGRPFVLTSGDVVVAPNASNFAIPGGLLQLPIGREATLESLDLRLMDDDVNTINFSLQLSSGKLQFFQNVGPPTFERWRASLRIEEQSRVQILVTNTTPGARIVRVGLNGWVYPIHKKLY